MRRRLALRTAMTGAAIGLAIAVLPACVAWKVRRGELRPYAALLGVAGALGGLAVARRRRWSDGEVALFLDARFGSHETITTALQVSREAPSVAHAAIVARAAHVLSRGAMSTTKTRLLSPIHSLAPLALLTLAVVARVPVPSAPVSVAPPGEAKVAHIEAEGLEKIATLARVEARDDEQRERLAKIARDAGALKEKLRVGLAKRDAQDQIARLREALDHERLSLGDGEKRAGLDSAVSQLEHAAQTQTAARALGDHDLQSMDAAMERVASSREKRDRALADEALRNAASAAAQAGAADVAKALEGERKLLAKRGARIDALRELARAMRDAGVRSDDAERALDSLDREGSDEAARALAQSLEEALSKLTPEERQRLAEKLAKQAKEPRTTKSGGASTSPPPDAKELEEQLRALAKDDAPSDEAARDAALDRASQGASETEAAIDGRNGNGATANGDGAGTGGSHDFGTGSHRGRTDPIAGDTLKSRAHAAMNAGNAMPSSVTTFAPGRAGDVATALATGDLRAAAPNQLDAVEKSDVPEEYREHVRQYFNPKGTTR